MNDSHDDHESAIKTPKQLIVAVVAAFVVPIIIIVLLVQFVTSSKNTGEGSDAQTEKAIATRISPIADEGFSYKDANAPVVLQTGEAVFTSTCSACHATGALGAPKAGDSGAWSKRIAQGYDTLLKNAVSGIRAMPAKGGNADLDDVEVGRAIVFMANKSGAKFKEPEAKAAAPAAAK